MKKRELIRWGMIGCGDVAEVKSGPGFYKAAGSALVAVMRRDGVKAADFAKRHGVKKWYTDAESLIADEEVDAVCVATPTGTHEFYAMKVRAAGKPCYVEKPMARNSAEARRMVEAFRAARGWDGRVGVPLFVAYYRRAMPVFLKVKELIESGRLGRVRTANYRYADGRMAKRVEPVAWRFVAEETGGGLTMEMGCHAWDLFDFWFGPLKVVESWARNECGMYALEDHAWASWVGGVSGEVKGSFEFNNTGGAMDEFEIAGDEATLRLACYAFGPLRLLHRDGREEIIDVPTPAHVQQPLIQTIVDELRGVTKVGSCPSTGESALRTQEVMDRVLEKYYGGREEGFWKRALPAQGSGVHKR